MTIVEMIVNMDCPGCERKVRRALKNLEGVDSVDIDMDLQKVTVTGWITQEKVLKKVRKTGKKAELWPFPYNPGYVGFTQQYSDLYASYSNPTTYFQSNQPPTSSYNYYMHEYNGHEHGTYQESPYSSYFQSAQPPTSTYNYYVHGYNGHERGTYQELPYSTNVLAERATTAFSDESVNSCSVM